MKLPCTARRLPARSSLPTRERELKRASRRVWPAAGASLPTRERELKHQPPQWPRLATQSLPTRERELKHRPAIDGALFFVAPHAGARIETDYRQAGEFQDSVAPHAGARIETIGFSGFWITNSVAPHAGARIETPMSTACNAGQVRRSPRGSAN